MIARRGEIELNIEELVLDGFAPSERHAIADALKLELENLLRQSDFITSADLSTLELDRLNAGSITLKNGERSSTVGSQLGRTLFESLNSIAHPDRASTSSARTNDVVQAVHSARSSK